MKCAMPALIRVSLGGRQRIRRTQQEVGIRSRGHSQYARNRGEIFEEDHWAFGKLCQAVKQFLRPKYHFEMLFFNVAHRASENDDCVMCMCIFYFILKIKMNRN